MAEPRTVETLQGALRREAHRLRVARPRAVQSLRAAKPPRAAPATLEERQPEAEPQLVVPALRAVGLLPEEKRLWAAQPLADKPRRAVRALVAAHA